MSVVKEWGDSLIGVAGTGTMGRGITILLASSGLDVLVWGRSDKSLDAFNSYVSGWFQKRVEQGKLDRKVCDESLSRISSTTELRHFSKAEFVVETVAEDLVVKRKLLRSLDRICSRNTVLASNTSSLVISELGSETENPERVIGMHFMNPPYVMPLIEIIPSSKTNGETVAKTITLAKFLGKDPLIVPDIPGFVVNRILFALLGEAIRLAESGVVDIPTVDKALKGGANHPMGPLELADFIGLDVCLAILDVLSQRLDDSKYDPPQMLKTRVSEGKLGRKSGEGFYTYPH